MTATRKVNLAEFLKAQQSEDPKLPYTELLARQGISLAHVAPEKHSIFNNEGVWAVVSTGVLGVDEASELTTDQIETLNNRGILKLLDVEVAYPRVELIAEPGGGQYTIAGERVTYDKRNGPIALKGDHTVGPEVGIQKILTIPAEKATRFNVKAIEIAVRREDVDVDDIVVLSEEEISLAGRETFYTTYQDRGDYGVHFKDLLEVYKGTESTFVASQVAVQLMSRRVPETTRFTADEVQNFPPAWAEELTDQNGALLHLIAEGHISFNEVDPLSRDGLETLKILSDVVRGNAMTSGQALFLGKDEARAVSSIFCHNGGNSFEGYPVTVEQLLALDLKALHAICARASDIKEERISVGHVLDDAAIGRAR